MHSSVLTELGLSSGEVSVYETLLRYGPLTATEIADHSGLYRPTVYEVLQRLSKRRFVSHISRKRRKFYQAADPQIFIDLFESKKRHIVETVRIMREKPINESVLEEEVEALGRNSSLPRFFKSLKVILRESMTTEMLIMGPIKRIYGSLDEQFPNCLQSGMINSKSNEIPLRVLSNSQDISFLVDADHIRFFPDGNDMYATTILTDVIMATISYSPAQQLILIRNRHIIGTYQKLFNMLWESFSHIK